MSLRVGWGDNGRYEKVERTNIGNYSEEFYDRQQRDRVESQKGEIVNGRLVVKMGLTWAHLHDQRTDGADTKACP